VLDEGAGAVEEVSEDVVIVVLEDSAARVGVGPLAVPTETLAPPHAASVTTSRRATAAREPATSPPTRTTDEHNSQTPPWLLPFPPKGKIAGESMPSPAPK